MAKGITALGVLCVWALTAVFFPGDVAMANSVVGVREIAAGGSHTCARTGEGRVLCWGAAGEGQLGIDWRNSIRVAPVELHSLPAHVRAIAAGGSEEVGHSCAALDDGVTCWGSNDAFQLGRLPGDYLCTCSPHPQAVQGLTGQVIDLALGESHSCAVTEQGEVKCWGGNRQGQLGIGTANSAIVGLVDVSGLDSGVVSIAAGREHTCALLASGGVKCWGDNAVGQLGDGTINDRSVPVSVCASFDTASGACLQELANALAIGAGARHTCAVVEGGAVRCWGAADGRLGHGTSEGSNTPLDVAGLDGPAAALALGAFHSCALMASGRVQCWGSNVQGELGVPTLGACPNTSPPNGECSYSAVEVCAQFDATAQLCDAPLEDVVAVEAGEAYNCALMSDTQVLCWGANGAGTLGRGYVTQDFQPNYVPSSVRLAQGKLTGDADCDATTNSIDAALILQMDAGLASPHCSQAADVNADGRVSSFDAALVLQYGAWIIYVLPVLD
jgi:alpha-tubulin suppressor-like RCC1 family protein